MRLFSIASLMFALLVLPAIAKGPTEEYNRVVQPQIKISELGPQYDGKVVTMVFKVADTFDITGSVPRGHYGGFGITVHLPAGSPSFYVLVMEDLANLMERFDLRGDKAKGLIMRATGKITVFPAPKNGATKGPSYQLAIHDWKGFRILPSANL